MLFAAFVADARSLKLCEAVDVVGFDAELRLDVAAHLLAPGFGSRRDPCLEFNCVLEPLFYDRLAEVGGSVGGSTAEIVEPRSCMNCIWRSVEPDDIGSVRRALCEPPLSPAPPVKRP